MRIRRGSGFYKPCTGAWGGELAVHYGVTSFWQTELAAEFEGSDHEDTEVAALAWKNIFQLAPKGTLFIDPGVMVEYAKSVTGGPDEVIGKLLVAKDLGQFSHLANIGIAREVGDESSNDNEYGFGYGVSYNLNEHLRLGGEWHSDFGDFQGDYDDQSHRAGPVAYGEITHGVHYEAGVLVGVSDSAPDAEFKAAFEYEF